MKKRIHILFFTSLFFAVSIGAFAQQLNIGGDSVVIDYASPKQYKIADISVSGTQNTDINVIKLLSGLSMGDKVEVPGDKFSRALENLWKQGLFDDIKISASRIDGEYIYIDINVSERPRIASYGFEGVSKGERDDLRDKLKLHRGRILTDYLLSSSIDIIKQHFVAKGFYNISVVAKKDSEGKDADMVAVTFVINKGEKIRISDIVFHGNSVMPTSKLYRTMKDTKRKRFYSIFGGAKFIEEKYNKDKPKIIAKYNQRGYRDAKIVKDTVYRSAKDRVKIEITIDEGHKYYFRNITWIGNSKYTSKELNRILGIKKGEVYDQAVLDSKLYMNQNGADVSSLYMDDGYLFFQLTPVEVLVEHDSIDLEMRIFEGKQAVVNRVTVIGNSKTNDRVIMREIRTRPGQLFRRSDIIRSQRELAQLGYFNPEKMNVVPTPDPASGTVDIEYTVEEKPSDQLELSAGFGAGRVVGTLGFSFTNFSTQNMFKKDAWRPLPSGDGQRFSIRGQSSGFNYQGYNFSFTEPWMGGKKPISFTLSGYHTRQSNRFLKQDPLLWSLEITGAAIGLGRRLKWPDDYFSLYQEINFQHYELFKYPFGVFSTGYINNFNYKFSISRNSVDRPIFETRGSNIAFTAQLTPPYSMFNNKDYSRLTAQEKFKFIEYQKYKFTAAFYTSLTNKRSDEGQSRNLVLYTKVGFGFLNTYNSKTPIPPFERFYLGGSGLSGFNPVQANEIIALRGYDDRLVYSGGDAERNSYTTYLNGSATICKYTAELRYPISLNPSATVYVMTFAEAGNSWANFSEFNPFQVKRSVGVGVRLFLPMFGLLGFDYAWGLDNIPGHPGTGRNPLTGKLQGQFHFIIGGLIGEL